jgi:hypothetical protein
MHATAGAVELLGSPCHISVGHSLLVLYRLRLPDSCIPLAVCVVFGGSPSPSTRIVKPRIKNLCRTACFAICAGMQVLEAAVVGVPHAKWGERPLLVVVPQPQYAPGEFLGFSTGPAGDTGWG